jgi:alkyldihydroxyacetonephosphate synthase
MQSGTQERRRKLYGWGYEGDEVSPREIVEFEKTWTRLIGVSDFTAVPFPTEDSINLRPSRVKATPRNKYSVSVMSSLSRPSTSMRHQYFRKFSRLSRAPRQDSGNPFPFLELDHVHGRDKPGHDGGG